MNSVDLVKKICKERKIPISQLERECGFSNGYIRGLTKGKFPSTRLQTIADYLGLPISYLMGETQEKEYYTDGTLLIARKIFDNKELRLLLDEASDADPEDIQTAYQMLLALKRKERKYDR